MKFRNSALFFYALFLTLVFNRYFHLFHLTPFIPFLCEIMTKNSLKKTLWVSFFAGFTLDCLQSQLPMGTFSLICIVSSLVLHKQQGLFFHDFLFSLSIFTGIGSILFSLLETVSFLIFGLGVPFSIYSSLMDCLIMASLDIALAFIAFSLPKLLFKKIQKKGGFRFIFKKILN